MSVIAALRRQRQEGQEFRIILGYIENVSQPGQRKTLPKTNNKPVIPNNNKCQVLDTELIPKSVRYTPHYHQQPEEFWSGKVGSGGGGRICVCVCGGCQYQREEFLDKPE